MRLYLMGLCLPATWPELKRSSTVIPVTLDSLVADARL
jgi:hypothetical protein